MLLLLLLSSPLQDALCFAGEGAAAGGGGVASPARWRFKIGPAHVNGYGALHGGCTASVIDSARDDADHPRSAEITRDCVCR